MIQIIGNMSLSPFTPPNWEELQQRDALKTWTDVTERLEIDGKAAVIAKINSLMADNKKCGPPESTQCK